VRQLVDGRAQPLQLIARLGLRGSSGMADASVSFKAGPPSMRAASSDATRHRVPAARGRGTGWPQW
jgi:hypothetical protein